MQISPPKPVQKMWRSVQVPRGPGHIKHAYHECLVLFKRGEAQMSVINDNMCIWIFNDFGVQHGSLNQLLTNIKVLLLCSVTCQYELNVNKKNDQACNIMVTKLWVVSWVYMQKQTYIMTRADWLLKKLLFMNLSFISFNKFWQIFYYMNSLNPPVTAVIELTSDTLTDL